MVHSLLLDSCDGEYYAPPLFKKRNGARPDGPKRCGILAGTSVDDLPAAQKETITGI